jgi:hypothetical protein
LLRIFKEEQMKFALINPGQQTQLGDMVRRIWEAQENIRAES